MEGRVKTRQPGVIPNTLGRQVGVLPVSSEPKPHKSSRDKTNGIPIGGTDIQPKPPSGSSTRNSASSKAHNTSGYRSKLDSKSYTDTNPISNDGLSNTRSSPASATSSGSTRTTGKSSGNVRPPPGSSKLSSASQRTSPASAQKSSLSSSALSRRSPGSQRSSHSHIDYAEVDADIDEPLDQDVKFTNVPSKASSRPASKVKRSPGSQPGSARSAVNSARSGAGSARSSFAEGSRKPPKTIDPDVVIAENQETDYNRIFEINLHANEITYIDNMEKFRKVKVLDLSCNFIDHIQNLELCKELKELKMYDNRLRKVENLENLKDLNSLQLQHNKIKTIGKGFSNLKKLKNLRIDCNQLLKIEAPELSPCVQLTVLDISYNMLDSLAALNYLPNLEELNASGNRLRSVSDLGKCKQLHEVDLSGNRITDLGGLRGLPKLLNLNISNNQLTSLKSMGRLKALQDLLASGNQIHELSTVSTQLPALETLDLVENEITDWDEFYYLEEMPCLVELFIAGNPFCTEDGPMPHYFSAIQAVLPNLEIIDGAHIKKHVSKGAPLMRPMSASSIVSLRQMDTQMKSADEQMQSLERSLQEKFAALRSTCDSLPAEPPRFGFSSFGLYSEATPTPSRCSSRSRILQARKFAESEDFN